MSQRTAARAEKETATSLVSGLLRHAGVCPVTDHSRPSIERPGPSFGRDFSQTEVRSTEPGVGQNYGTPACPVFPRTCPFGGACDTCPLPVQARLRIGQPGDKYEREADQVANLMMRMPGPQTTWEMNALGPGAAFGPNLRRRASNQVMPPTVYEALRSPSQSLELVKQGSMESRFGQDFSRMPVKSGNPTMMMRMSSIRLQRQALPDDETKEPPSSNSEEIPDTGQGVTSAEGPPTKLPPYGTEVAEGQASQAQQPSDEDEQREGVLQRKTESTAPARRLAGWSYQGLIEHLGAGQPLDVGTRKALDVAFGADLSTVRVHTDSRADNLARNLSAQAFTIGNHIAFASGYHQPAKPEGQWLLAHEVTHVLQQRAAAHYFNADLIVGYADDAYEREANRIADATTADLPEDDRDTVGGHVSLAPPVSGAQRLGIQLFNHGAAAAYARTWAKSTNPKYGRFSNDCTNFVSQAMLAGGWRMIGGSFFDRKRNDVWWFGKSWFSKASYTWGGAQNFANFLSARSAGTRESNPMALQEGDVLQMKFADHSDIGHSMVVTKKSSTDLYLSYHTSDHLDEPLSAIKARNAGAMLIPWKISDPSY